jgi:DNA-binding transcriptional regulator YiaG
MSPAELEALRRILFFSVNEAASLISYTSEQTWYRWETGRRQVPADIAKAIEQLIAWRRNAIQRAIDNFSAH